MKDTIYGADLFLPLLLILIETFFTTYPFVSDKEYMENFCDNFIDVSDELFSKYLGKN